MISVFIDTFVVITITALVIITSLYVKNPSVVATTANSDAVKVAVASVFNFSNIGNTVGGVFVAVCLTFFAFSTIIGVRIQPLIQKLGDNAALDL